MVLAGRNEGLVFCGDAVLLFGLSEQYHVSLHWLCLGNCRHVLDAKRRAAVLGVGLASNGQ